MKRTAAVAFISGLVCAGLVAGVVHIIRKDYEMPLVHKLQFPLLLAGSDVPDQHYLLPKGTSLYYDQAFPEGFVRYKIFVNVEGVKLESKEATEKYWLDPLTAFPVDANSLRRLLSEYPLSKEDLASILRSSSLSKQEIRSVLEQFSE